MKKSLLVIFFLSLPLLFTQCKKINNCKGISPEFTEEDKRWVSTLKVNDSLIFETAIGKSDTFYVSSIIFDKMISKGDKLGLEGPPCADNDVPVASISYSTIKNPITNKDIFFSATFSRQKDGHIEDKFIIEFSPYTNTFSNIPKEVGGSLVVKDLGQLEVNGFTYKEVQYYEKDISNFSPNERIMHKMYYSKESGLVRFDLADGESWLRKKII